MLDVFVGVVASGGEPPCPAPSGAPCAMAMVGESCSGGGHDVSQLPEDGTQHVRTESDTRELPVVLGKHRRIEIFDCHRSCPGCRHGVADHGSGKRGSNAHSEVQSLVSCLWTIPAQGWARRDSNPHLTAQEAAAVVLQLRTPIGTQEILHATILSSAGPRLAAPPATWDCLRPLQPPTQETKKAARVIRRRPSRDKRWNAAYVLTSGSEPRRHARMLNCLAFLAPWRGPANQHDGLAAMAGAR